MFWLSGRALPGRLNSSCKGSQAVMRKHAQAFTLIELLVTIAIAAILLSVATPSFRNILLNSRLSSQVDGLVTGLNYARNSALSGNVNTTVCPIGATNSTVCGADWGAGWMTVNDPAGTPTLLHRFVASPGLPVLSAVDANNNPAAQVTFDPRGLASSKADFVWCDARGTAFARSASTLATGYVQAGATPGQSVWGAALSCP